MKENPDPLIQVEKILSLKILDPAMGSGHFLVGVVEYIATRICEIEFGEVSEKEYIEKKRDVVRRCIYGVDINPLAVCIVLCSGSIISSTSSDNCMLTERLRLCGFLLF